MLLQQHLVLRGSVVKVLTHSEIYRKILFNGQRTTIFDLVIL